MLDFLKKNNNIILDENASDFNDIFLKKNKNFFFKNKNRIVKNNFINYLFFEKFSILYENNLIKNTIHTNNNYLNLFFFKKYFIFYTFFKVFNQHCLFNLNKKSNFLFKLKSNNLYFCNHNLNLFKKKNFFFKNVNLKKRLFFNHHLNFFLTTFSINFNTHRFVLNSFNGSNNNLILENNLINFFFKNFCLFEKNFKLNYSTNFVCSFFYNSFFTKQNIQTNLNTFTNYTPFNSIDLLLTEKIFSKLNVNYVPSFYKYVYYGLSNSIEFILKKKLFLKIFSKSFKKNSISDHIDYLFLKNKSIQSRIGRGFFLHEMLDIVYTTFFYKDLNFLIKWFIKTMNRISFLNHKKFLSSFKQIIYNNSDFFIKNNNIRGFFFDIRGKVGVTGDSKKRHFSFYVGDFSKTTKKYKFDYQFDIVRTYTGALGITMYLSYK